MLLDAYFDPEGIKRWFGSRGLAERWKGERRNSSDEGFEDSVGDGGDESSRWSEHVETARALVSSVVAGEEAPHGIAPLGPQPDDLAEVVALIAIAAPATCLLRTFGRVLGPGFSETGTASTSETSAWIDALKFAAARESWAFRDLFNLPEVLSLVRGLDPREPYWRRVLEYCGNGCLQSALDEYAHTLYESLGLMDLPAVEAIERLSGAFRSAMSIRAATVAVDDISVNPRSGTIAMEQRRMRSRFAMRFGDEKSEEDRYVARAGQVRDAFNSPFWPFVLATTSIGQEGLDFHSYCHAVVHWDLPSNPVDLEQREGRVHRYKGHAVRKNVARDYGLRGIADVEFLRCLGEGRGIASDVWSVMFDAARDARVRGCTVDGVDNDLTPYWIYVGEVDDPSDAESNGVKGSRAYIERHVPAIPLSRDIEKLQRLRRSLAVYRMVFGQPRQEDLLEYLVGRFPPERIEPLLDELRIDLSPPESTPKAVIGTGGDQSVGM